MAYDGEIQDVSVVEEKKRVVFEMTFRDTRMGGTHTYEIPPDMFFGYVFTFGDGNPKNLIGKRVRWGCDGESGRFAGMILRKPG
jgi:hypothetical protein